MTTREDNLTEQQKRLQQELIELELIRARLAKMPATFAELLDWLEHYRLHGNRVVW